MGDRTYYVVWVRLKHPAAPDANWVTAAPPTDRLDYAEGLAESFCRPEEEAVVRPVDLPE